MSAAALWTRSLWRRHWRATIMVGLFLGVAAGAAMTAWEYSRRAGSAVDRWAEFVRPPEQVPEGCPPDADPQDPGAACFDFSMVETLYDALEGSEQITGIHAGAGLPVTLSAGKRSVSATMGAAIRVDGRIDRPFVVSGRTASPDATDEVTLTPVIAEALGVGVDDVIGIDVCDWQFVDDAGPCTAVGNVRVVGLVENLDSLQPTRTTAPGAVPRIDGRGVGPSAAGWASMSVGHTVFGTTEFRIADGVTTDDVQAELQSALPGYFVRITASDATLAIEAIRRTVGLERSALWILAVTMAGIAVVFSTQVLARQLRREMSDRDVVRSLGAGRSTVATAASLRAIPTAVVAVVAAAATTLVASQLGPGGLAGRLEVDPGARFDGTVVAVGAFVLLIGTVATSALAAALTSRPLRGRSSGPLSRRIASTSPVVRAGWSLGGAGRRQFLWPAAGGLVLAVLVVGVASSLSGNLQRTRTTPAAFGASWDYGLTSTGSGGLTSQEQADAAVEQVLADPIATSAAFVFSSIPLDVDGTSLFSVFAMSSLKGSIEPVIVDGRAPVTDDEIALGPRTLDEFGLNVGDQLPTLPSLVTDPGTGEPAGTMVGPWTVVGVALISDDDDVGPGKGALLTEEGMQRLVDGFDDAVLVVTTDGSLTPEAEVAHFSESFGPFITVPSPPVDITNLSPLARVPWVIAAFLGLLAAAVLFHALVNCAQLGRRQLSTLRALGFESPQARGAVGALAALIAVPAAMIGAVGGVVAGHWAWALVRSRVGLGEVTTVAFATIALAAGGAVVVAGLVSIIPARRAVGRSLVEGLRAE